MQKLDGVESVKVSLNEGHARIALKPDNTITLGQLRDLVKRSGFTPQEAAVTAEVDVITRDGQILIKIAGLEESFALAPQTDASIADAIRKQVGAGLLVEGTVIPSTEQGDLVLQVTAVSPSTRKGG